MKLRGLLIFGFLQATMMPSSSTMLPNLRRYGVAVTVGRFVVPRDKLEAIIRNRTNEDHQCGNCEYFY